MNGKKRGWLVASGILFLIVGLLALSSPILFSFLIVRLLAVFALVSGAISLLVTIFGKDVASRGLNAVFALVRIVAGLALLYCIPSGLRVITLVFAVYLMVEGVFGIFGAFKIREQSGWGFVLLNGLVTLALGVMVYAHWPTASVWILGFFFGISLLVHGLALLMLGLSAPKTVTQG
jgi:uncharacterized membrane protein HdeD (DUF308 family)